MRAKVACTLVAISLLEPQVGGPQHPRGATVSPPAWQVSARPILVIGMEGGSDYEFLRVVAAARLRDGRIVALGATLQRILDPSGGLVRTVGGPGHGPGETGAMGRFSDGRWFAKGEDQLVHTSAGSTARPRKLTRGDWDAWVQFMSQLVPREQMAEYRSLVDRVPRMEVLPAAGWPHRGCPWVRTSSADRRAHLSWFR